MVIQWGGRGEVQEWRRENLIDYFQVNWNVFICIIDRSVVLVKTQDETSAMNSGIFSSHFPPSEDPKIYPHNTLLFSLLLYQKEDTSSYKKIYPSYMFSMMPQQETCSNNYSLFLLTLLSLGVSCFWPIILMPSLLLFDHILFLSFKLLYSDSLSHLFSLQFTKICLLSLACHWDCSS